MNSLDHLRAAAMALEQARRHLEAVEPETMPLSPTDSLAALTDRYGGWHATVKDVLYYIDGELKSIRLQRAQQAFRERNRAIYADPSPDAYCASCTFTLQGGSNVGLCPRCGSSKWYRTDLTTQKATQGLEDKG